jgi:hypothetical protein
MIQYDIDTIWTGLWGDWAAYWMSDQSVESANFGSNRRDIVSDILFFFKKKIFIICLVFFFFFFF